MIEEISSWTWLLAAEGGHEEEGGPEEIRTLIHEQLAELRKLLAYGVETETERLEEMEEL
jgi:hypothetical protein